MAFTIVDDDDRGSRKRGSQSTPRNGTFDGKRNVSNRRMSLNDTFTVSNFDDQVSAN